MFYPLKFCPIFKSVIWGGEKIISYKGLNSGEKSVGESWELSGITGSESIVENGEFAGRSIVELLREYKADIVGKGNYERFGNELPLLIKFIDAYDDLSIQVHPDDVLAQQRHNSRGKTEMWYVIDGADGAKVSSGFSRDVTPDEYVESVENSTICDLLMECEVKKGDIFFLPAGRIHSIGAGCFIAEIQQSSNVTYRIYDFDRRDAKGNSRELHTQQAVEAIDFRAVADPRIQYDYNAEESKVVECDYFVTSVVNFTSSRSIDYSALDSFVIYICVEGCALVNGVSLNQGETLFIPAAIDRVDVETTNCRVLISYI